MDRQYYLGLAESGLKMPIGADLVLHEKEDPEAILVDGERLGKVVAESAVRFGSPLAVPRMDLELEKKALLTALGVPEDQTGSYHFKECPDEELLQTLSERIKGTLTPRLEAHMKAIRYIATQTDLLPVGMAIGPFSLMTKLVPDPITPIALAGCGMGAEDDDEIRTVERVLEMGLAMILRSVRGQIEAGARAIFIAEPAANKVYLSPNQIESGSDIFERYVMAYDLRLKALLNETGTDLFFHCCGELTDYMLGKFVELDPAIMSLGSSRKLWEDARLVPKSIVLFGNLPSKRFYSDSLISREEVEQLAGELVARMKEVGHPFILGSECDVLAVPGCENAIWSKVAAITGCGNHCCGDHS